VSERTSWQRVARRIRVPLGFVFAGLFLWLAQPTWKTIALSLLLVVPGVWLRGYAAGYVKKNAEITQTGPYGYTRNPLYLGSMMIAFGFAVASGSWVILVALMAGFLAIYLPTIRSEEAYLREHFAGFDEYMRRLFAASSRFVIVYASNSTSVEGAFSPHVKHRRFTDWVALHEPSWKLAEHIPNAYPYRGDYQEGSFADFYIFQHTE